VNSRSNPFLETTSIKHNNEGNFLVQENKDIIHAKAYSTVGELWTTQRVFYRPSHNSQTKYDRFIIFVYRSEYVDNRVVNIRDMICARTCP